jgi:hypothetical protein
MGPRALQHGLILFLADGSLTHAEAFQSVSRGHARAMTQRPSALIAAAQTVEHYEITRYGSLIAWAVVIGDADDSYDFSGLDPFIAKLRAGSDLVMGNRFAGGIAPGAMPFLHRYLGNPVLSFIGRVFFRAKIGDFHCGLRGFRRDAILGLNLRTSGMELASEMVVRAAVVNLNIAEVPTTLAVDGRSRPPHLRTWHDGWRHLRFLLMFSPRWLFLYPGLALVILGAIGVAALFPGPLMRPISGSTTIPSWLPRSPSWLASRWWVSVSSPVISPPRMPFCQVPARWRPCCPSSRSNAD